MRTPQYFSYITAAFALLLAIPSSAETTATASAEAPNVILIVVDDWGYTDSGSYGSKFYETPNLDRLASQGLQFTDAYAACPVCSPSRAGLLTGKFPARTGVTDYLHDASSEKARRKSEKHKLMTAPFTPGLDLKEETLAEALKKGGYSTFMMGKWHLGNKSYAPEQQGFDTAIAASAVGAPKNYFSPYNLEGLENGPDGEYLTDRQATETIKFMEQKGDKPFFVYLPFYAPHIPLQARPDLVKKYEAKRAKMGLKDEYTSDGEIRVRQNHSDVAYAAMVENVDEAVGQVVAALKRLNLEDNTIVIFTSDNGGVSTTQGWPTANVPLRTGKGWMYEGGIRVPLIISWPKVIKQPRKVSSVVIGTDYYPTLLEAAGLPLNPAQHVDGKSFLKVIKGEDQSRGAIFWHYPHYGDQLGSPASAVRDGKWKLIRWYEDNRTELFNLEKDLSEKQNVAADNPEVVKDLSAKLDAWLKDAGAKFPTPNPNYKPE